MNKRLSRAVAAWRWYFHSAAAEMGIRSSWEPLCQLAQNGGGDPSRVSDGYDERRLNAAGRHARIEAALLAMPPYKLGMLRLAAEQDLAPCRAAFGEFGNLAHYTAEATAACPRRARSVEAWLDRLGMRLARGRGDKLIAQSVRDGTERILEGVADAYRAAQRRIA